MKTKLFTQTNNSILFVLLLSLYPLFLGGNRPFPIYLFGMGFSITAFIALYLQGESSFWKLKPIKCALLWVLGLLSFLLFSVFFIAPHPFFPIMKWIQYLSYAMIFLQVLIFAHTKNFFHRLNGYSFIAAVFYAIYGIVALSCGDMVLFYDKTSYFGSLTSVFINRNHIALYLNIGFLCGLYNIISHVKQRNIFLSGRPTVIIVEFLNYLLSSGLWRFLGLAVILMALFMTNSRGGVIQLVASLLIAGSLYQWKSVGRISKRLIAFYATSILIISIFLSSGFSAALKDRMHYLDASLTERQAVWTTTKKIIRDNLFTGAGIGQFEVNFNHYRNNDITLNKIWDKSHNDYYEVLAEYGIFYAFFLWAGICTMVYRCYKRMNSKDGRRMALILSMFIMCSLHATYDFGLQMPAIASLWISFLAYGFSRTTLVK